MRRYLGLAAACGMIACSAATPSQSPEEARGSSSFASSLSPARAPIHLALHPDESTPLSLQVAPDAECTIRDMTPQPDLLANTRGVLRFNLQVPSDGTDLSLDCTRPDGTTDAYAIDVVAAASGQPVVATNVDPARRSPGVVRAPLTEDALSLTDAELVARGFPPPPNREPSSPAFAHWLAQAKTPALEMTPHPRPARPRLVPSGGRVEGSGSPSQPTPQVGPHGARALEPYTASPTTETAWSGYIAEPNYATWEATGSWVVPSITNSSQSSAMGEWVGVGGWFDGDMGLIQAGTSGQTYSRGAARVSSYNAFYEYWGSNSSTFPNYLDPADQEWRLPVAAGDSYEVTVWDGNSSGAAALQGGYGWYFVFAQPANPSSQAEYFIGSLPKPTAAPPFQGWTAEWIVELPVGASALSDFGGTRISSATAYGPNGYTQTPGDSNPAEVSSIVDGSNDYLDVAFQESSAVGFFWTRAN
jgi:hypothetical protein